MLILGFLLGIASLICVGLITLRSSNDFVTTAKSVAGHQQVLNETSEIRRILTRAETIHAGFLLTGQSKYLVDFDETPVRLKKAFQQLRALTSQNQEDIDTSETKAHKRFEEMKNVLAVYRNEGAFAARREVSNDFGLALLNGFGDALNRIEAREQKALKLAEDQNERTRQVVAVVLGAGLSIAVVAVFFSMGTVLRDISRRLYAEESLNQNVALQTLIFKSANVGFVATDLEGRITMFNRAAEKWLGYKENEVLGRMDMGALFHDPEELARAKVEIEKEIGERLPSSDALFTALPMRGHRFDREWTYIRRDGTRFPVMLSVSPLRRRLGDIVGFVWVTTNLSKEKEARAQLDRYVRDLEIARAQAEDKNRELEATASELKVSRDIAVAATRTKSEFLANMSHEIRTPMNGVMGMAHLLQSTDLNDRQKGFVNTIQRSAESLLSILNDILDFSKMEAGKMTLDLSPFDLRATVEDICESMAAAADKQGIEIVCRVQPEIPEQVMGDSGRLGQVLGNLLSNAIKFTLQGEVVVSVTATLRSENRWDYRIAIRDTGIGIPTDRLERIFESFTQADGSMTRKFGGTGLGLAISRQLVELMGGNIVVESEPGKGSEFAIELSLDPIEPVSQTVSEKRDLRQLRVLLVEDNPTARSVYEELLTSWNCSVTTIVGGAGAIELVHDRSAIFDVVILDRALRDQDGITTAEAIRSLPGGSSLSYVLLVSGGYQAESENRLKMFNAVLVKPVRSAILYESLNHIPTSISNATHEISIAETKSTDGWLSGLNILLVEDNIVNQMVATEILAGWGCDVETADNGAIAVSMVARRDYDLILMDLQMPVMDGLRATGEIRSAESEAGRHVPILAMTANAMNGDREQCLAAGMDGYVSKPVLPKVLMENLMVFFPERKDAANHAPDAMLKAS